MFILPLFLSDHLGRYRILCWQFFLPCFLSSIFYYENIAHHSIFLFCFHALSSDFLSVFWTLQFHYNVLMQIYQKMIPLIPIFSFNVKVYYLLFSGKFTFIFFFGFFLHCILSVTSWPPELVLLIHYSISFYCFLSVIFLFIVSIFCLSNPSAILSSFILNLLLKTDIEFLKNWSYWSKIYIPQNEYILSINLDEFWEMCIPV